MYLPGRIDEEDACAEVEADGAPVASMPLGVLEAADGRDFVEVFLDGCVVPLGMVDVDALAEAACAAAIVS